MKRGSRKVGKNRLEFSRASSLYLTGLGRRGPEGIELKELDKGREELQPSAARKIGNFFSHFFFQFNVNS